jgi:pimeloyl-ACP methyl ester carboxylesterase
MAAWLSWQQRGPGMTKFEASAATRVLGLVAVTAAIAACGNGVPSSTAAGSSSGPASTPAGSTTPVLVSDLPLDVTHAQVTALFTYDTSKPLDINDATPAKTKDGVITRDLTYASADGSSVAAWLVAPSGNGPFAAVLFLHWLAANSNRDEFLDEATALAKRGVVSLLPTRLFPGVANPTDWRTDRQSIVDQTSQLRRGLDVLLAQPGVDASRVAFVGHDYGAMDGAILAAVDRRLKAVVLMAPDATWSDWFFKYFPFLPAAEPEYSKAMKEFDPVAFVPQIAPTPLYLQFSGQDPFVSSEVAKQLTQAAGNPTTTTYASVAHDLQDDATVTADRDAWLADQLGLPG